jgi:hypothetical protein
MERKSRFSKEYLEEAEARIKEMENPDYEFPKPFSKADWILAIGLIIICGVAIIAVGFMQ